MPVRERITPVCVLAACPGPDHGNRAVEIEHEAMTRMRSRYRESLPDKVERLRCMQRSLDQPGVPTELRAFAHQLAGSGATFGWPEISDAAAHVEHADAAELAPALGRLIDVVDEAIAVVPG